MQRSIIAPAERVTNLRWGIAVALGAIFFVWWWARPGVGAGIGAPVALVTAIPLGIGLDRFGLRVIATATAAVFALAALLGVAAQPLPAQVLLGLGVAALLPLAAKLAATWFPRRERIAAAAIALAGIVVAALAGPAPSLLPAAALAAAAGLLVWFAYREPEQNARLTHAERSYIAQGGAQPARAVTPLGATLRARGTWLLAGAAGAAAFGLTLLFAYLAAQPDAPRFPLDVVAFAATAVIVAQLAAAIGAGGRAGTVAGLATAAGALGLVAGAALVVRSHG